ncbi:hypothetical protein K490DRAFT_40565 [Saccharata proteae CBS 121410]|uniref:Vegetatible incompatibility protein HET-E-1 n=1 Tax=Saccharata proteae CBS 121410 TaxID=1314787 RepID=A0A9P4HY76_9PEZI|nr:hypothetical protein K490DRAFT_40565 [Saccharata proteae CBS 121410]
MNDYEARRLENIKRNQALVSELGLEKGNAIPKSTTPTSHKPTAKRRKLNTTVERPTRTSARIASSGPRPSYNEYIKERSSPPNLIARPGRQPKTSTTKPKVEALSEDETASTAVPPADLETIQAGWTSWEPVAPEPTRDALGTFHFESHPDFTPNKSPEEILREGCFGGSYFRPLYSKALATTITDDWRELPDSWISGLQIERYLTNSDYYPEINKYGVACGQSIEEWEAAGWINHNYDVRGWFQWYCRFWMGRRCDDDDRQVSRWKKCVGERGRWRTSLLKKYVATGIRNVTDEGDDDEERGDVSPVVHQTCHHWAYEVRQEALNTFWEEGR